MQIGILGELHPQQLSVFAWQVFIIDAERGRALVRPLPGGIEQNAAAFEAVASIVASAVSALREGLEVASLPLESVVSPSASETARPRASATSATSATSAPEGKKVSDEPSLLLRGSLAASAASFDREAPVTFGLLGSLGLTLAPGVGVRVSAYRHLSAEFASSLGSFQLNRTGAALGAGWTVRARRLELEPEAGVVLEWLRRMETDPALSTEPGETAQKRVSVRSWDCGLAFGSPKLWRSKRLDSVRTIQNPFGSWEPRSYGPSSRNLGLSWCRPNWGWSFLPAFSEA